MSLALRELRRRPGRFAVVGAALTFLVVLLLLLGGLLDGLTLGSSGAFRAQRADVIVYGADAGTSFARSRLTAEVRRTVEDTDGVTAVGGLGAAQVAGAVPGEDELADVAVLGYELAPEDVPAPPPDGEGWADRRLEADGVAVGDELRLGPGRVPVRVAGWVDGTSYLGQGSLWVSPATWREVLRDSRPDQALDDGTFQALVVRGGGSLDAAALAARIDRATDGATESLTKQEAIDAVPGSAQQRVVFNGLIGVTLFVAGLVAALFFALLIIERTPLYATLKALGARSRTIGAGLVVQAAVVASGALVIGGALSWLLARAVPPGVPVELRPERALTTAALVLLAAVVGGLVPFRRIARIEPAIAIG
jgi:putative ABC transport system permease protein